MRAKAVKQGIWKKSNYISWFEFWHPAKAEALKAEQELNNTLLRANAQQDQLEADMSLKLTLAENAKMIILVVLAFIGFIVINKYA